MKYAIVIPDGGADAPIADLDGLTPFEAAATPNLDRLSMQGRLGTVATTPDGCDAGSDVCCLTLFGYDARVFHTGRAPLEAAALGVTPGPSDWMFRLNLVTTGEAGTPDAGIMLDHSAGHISDAEGRRLVTDLMAFWREHSPELAKGLSVTPGVSYRHVCVDASGRDWSDGSAANPRPLRTTPPHEIPGLPWAKHLPTGARAEDVIRLMALSERCFAAHEVNVARRASGLRPATMAWLWGQGVRPAMPTFEEKYGVRGCMITAVDLLAGMSTYLEWDRIPVPGITGYHDTDYAAKGQAACDALDRYDLVVVHIEAPDEASHQGDWETKVASLESIDREIIGPVVRKLETFGDQEVDAGAVGWRILVAPDHYTLVSTRRHDATPPPFAMGGAWVRSVLHTPLTETHAGESDLHVNPGSDLMEYFLFSGLNHRAR